MGKMGSLTAPFRGPPGRLLPPHNQLTPVSADNAVMSPTPGQGAREERFI